MEARPEFQQTEYAAVDLDPPAVRPQRPAEQFENRALPRAVATDYSQRFALRHRETNVPQRPELFHVHARVAERRQQ